MKNWRIEYSNIFSFGKFTNRISEYIRIFQNYESNTRIYSFGQNSIFVFEYWIFGEQYSNIQIYSNIRLTLAQPQLLVILLLCNLTQEQQLEIRLNNIYGRWTEIAILVHHREIRIKEHIAKKNARFGKAALRSWP